MDGSHIQLRRELLIRSALGLVLLLCLRPSAASGDKVNAEWYSSVRALSMGNTGIAHANDPQTAMFYNPALLARQRKTNFEFFNPQLEFGLGNIAIAKSASDYSRQLNLRNAYPLLNATKNKPSSFSASLYPNFYAQNFAFGVLGSAQSSAYVASNGELTYRSRYLVIPTMAMSVGLLSGRIRIGLAGRAVNSTQNDKTVSSPDDEGYVVNAQEGFGIGLDAGMTVSLPWSALPTFGFVARNVGDTSLSMNPIVRIAKGVPVKHDLIKKTYDAGFSIAPKVGQRTVLTFASDYRDVLDTYGVAMLRKINLGFEIATRNIFHFRFGVSRGYWTAGFGIRSKSSSLDLGSYADEMDATGFRKVEDRRVAIRYGGQF